MIVTDDEELARVCRSLRNQGRGEMGAWLEHERLGFNYRMDEMSAALGVSQISRLDQILARRAAVAAMYTERLAGLEWVRPPVVRPEVEMSWFVYVVLLDSGHRPRRRHRAACRAGSAVTGVLLANPPAAVHPRTVRDSRRHAPRD